MIFNKKTLKDELNEILKDGNYQVIFTDNKIEIKEVDKEITNTTINSIEPVTIVKELTIEKKAIVKKLLESKGYKEIDQK